MCGWPWTHHTTRMHGPVLRLCQCGISESENQGGAILWARWLDRKFGVSFFCCVYSMLQWQTLLKTFWCFLFRTATGATIRSTTERFRSWLTESKFQVLSLVFLPVSGVPQGTFIGSPRKGWIQFLNSCRDGFQGQIQHNSCILNSPARETRYRTSVPQDPAAASCSFAADCFQGINRCVKILEHIS